MVFKDSEHDAVVITTRYIHQATWTRARITSEAQMQATDRLEKLDLRSHEFRVRDDFGQAVDLKHVRNALASATLVGTWVLADGAGTTKAGRLIALDDVTITALDDPAQGHVGASVASVAELLESAPGPDPNDAIDLTEEGFRAYLKAASA